jgi:hypothetical protein
MCEKDAQYAMERCRERNERMGLKINCGDLYDATYRVCYDKLAISRYYDEFVEADCDCD